MYYPHFYSNPMKNSFIIGIVTLQLFTFIGLWVVAYKIYSTEQLVLDTRASLSTTIAVMNDIDAEQQKAKEAANRQLQPGQPVPNFSLLDEAGKTVSLAAYKGQSVLVAFTHPDCEHCQAFYPVLNEFQAQKPEVKVLVFQLENTPAQNKIYKQEHNIEVPLLAASTEEMVRYQVDTTPTSILIDKEGKLVAKGVYHQLSELMQLVEGKLAQ